MLAGGGWTESPNNVAKTLWRPPWNILTSTFNLSILCHWEWNAHWTGYYTGPYLRPQSHQKCWAPAHHFPPSSVPTVQRLANSIETLFHSRRYSCLYRGIESRKPPMPLFPISISIFDPCWRSRSGQSLMGNTRDNNALFSIHPDETGAPWISDKRIALSRQMIYLVGISILFSIFFVQFEYERARATAVVRYILLSRVS